MTLEVRDQRLENGLRVVSSRIPSQSVSIGIWVAAGGRYEDPQNSGVSHFLEHLLFKGTKKRDVHQVKEAIEGKGGHINAFTGEEYTCYYVKVLKRDWVLGLDVLSDIAQDPLLRQEDIDKERPVVLEEIRMYEDRPSQQVQERLQRLMWPDQPLGTLLTGTPQTLACLNRPEIVKYQEAYYHPTNIVVSVCGDLEISEVAPAVAQFFSRRNGRAASKFSPARVSEDGPVFDFLNKKTEQMHLALGMHACSRKDPRRYALNVLHIILGANMSSRLFNEIREKRGLAYDIHTGISHFTDTGAFVVSLGCDPQKVTEAAGVLRAELDRIAREPVTADELSRAKEFAVGHLLLSLEDTAEVMMWQGEKLLVEGERAAVEPLVGKIQAVTADELLRLAREQFQPSRYRLASVGQLSDADQRAIQGLLSDRKVADVRHET